MVRDVLYWKYKYPNISHERFEQLHRAVCPGCTDDIGGYLNKKHVPIALQKHAKLTGCDIGKYATMVTSTTDPKVVRAKPWLAECAACGREFRGATSGNVRKALGVHQAKSSTCLDGAIDSRVWENSVA